MVDTWYAQHFELGVGTITAVIVAMITNGQWRTNREKLRLDLYSKRFDIYMRTFDFYNALLGWNDEPEQVALIAPFYRAYRESRFLFPDSAGIFTFMKEFSEHAFFITHFYEVRNGFGESFPNERAALGFDRTGHVNWILTSITTLEERLAPFLNFHAL